VETTVVLLSAPGRLGLDQVEIIPPLADDVVFDIKHSGISTGTEKLGFHDWDFDGSCGRWITCADRQRGDRGQRRSGHDARVF
jgi:hypothetical protein